MIIKEVYPLDDKILVKIIEDKEETTSSGIVLPQTAGQEKPILGQVKAIGDSEMIKVKEGEYVLFSKFAGTEFQVEQENYVILQASDILAKVRL